MLSNLINMKRIGFFALFAAICLMMSCASMNQPSSRVSNNTSAYAAGSACGSAIRALHKQYQKDGTLDLSNPTNIYNLAMLAGNSSDLKTKMKDKNYYEGFTLGTLAGSQNLISRNIMKNMVQALVGSDLTAFQRKSTSIGQQAANTVSSIVTLLSMLKN